MSILGWWGYQQSYSLWIRHHLRMAQEAEDQFDFERAYAELAICLKHRPEDAKVNLFAARIARRGIRFDEAEEHLAEAARLDKDEKALESVLRLESAMLFCQRGDLLHSQKFLEDSRQGDPPETNLILEALAGGCMQIGLIGKAKEYLDQLLERDPNHVIGLLWRGQLYDRRALTDKALADFQKAVDVLPDLPASRLFLGEFLLRLQKPNEALEHFEFLKKRTPHDARALLGWAQCQLALGNTEAAIDLLDEVLKLDPKYREALVQRASIALNANEPEKAEKWLRMAQELLPFDRDTNYQLALCLNKLGRHEEADEYNRKAQEEEKARKALKA
jgi:tetratricopeptide (TPR) repeat protein